MALLRTLRIRNLVIAEDLTVDFGPGLNLLTGETGAGKSILVNALGLVAGARADRSLVRAGTERATVEALFDLEAGSPAVEWLREQLGEPDDAQLLVRREVASAGAGRILINGSPCTAALLRDLATHLLELHGQHDPKSLLESDRHLELLDACGDHADELERVAAAYETARQARTALTDLRALSDDRGLRLDELRRTIGDIDELDPREGELDTLDREHRVLQNSERIAELLDGVVQAVYEGEPAAASLAAAAARRAEELADLDPALTDPAERIRAAAIELEDAGAVVRQYRDRADFDPARLEAIATRRVALERLCLRFATDEAGLVERRSRAAEELATLDRFDERLAAAEGELAAAEQRYASAAAALTRRRRAAGKRLATAVGRQLAALALGKATFRVELIPRKAPTIDGPGRSPIPLTALGAERAELMIAANPGEPLRPLRQVASGGELSRVMLALHVVAESPERGRTLVFDEIDAGVGGAVADAVGARLQRLSRKHQLLCITHLPQVAAYADRHFRVAKHVAEGRTHAAVVGLEGGDRVEELARMLGGRQPTATSRRHASELLSSAGRAARPRSRSRA